jgi:hypothetical protein
MLTITIVTPIAMWLFGFSLGIMIGVVSPIFVIPGVIFLGLLWARRGGRNIWN